MTLELSEANWIVELATQVRLGKISPFARDQLIELIHTGGKRGIPMPEETFTKLTGEVFTIKFPEVEKKFILSYKAGRTYFTSTAW